MALIQMTYLSKALLRTVEVQVILPVDKIFAPGSGRERKEYKTLYQYFGRENQIMKRLKRQAERGDGD